jgi:hypothetical protein
VSLSLLYRQNAQLCSEMAARTSSVEVREEWLALATSWQKKAASHDGSILAGGNYREPLSTSLNRAEVQVAEIVPDAAKVVPEDPASTCVPTTDVDLPDRRQRFEPVDEFWDTMMAEIRGR